MLKFSLTILAMSLSVFSWGQTFDTLISLEGDTALVKVTGITEKKVTYRIPTSPDLEITESKNDYASIHFADKNVTDFDAQRNLLKNEQIFLTTGYSVDPYLEFIRPTFGFGVDAFLTQNFGFEIQFGLGIDTEGNNGADLLEFSVLASYRDYMSHSGWFGQYSLGVRSSHMEVTGPYYHPEDNVVFVLSPVIGYTFKSGIEGSFAPLIGMNGRTPLYASLQLRLGYRF